MNDATVFYSPTLGELDLSEVVSKVGRYIQAEPRYNYRVIVGTDSQDHQNGERFADFVSAVVVHRVGAGGIYFWQRERMGKVWSLKERIFEEAYRSLKLGQTLVSEFEKEKFSEGFHLEVHVDIGEKGETRTIINEVVGMIRGTGFEVKIKPDAFAASKVADRYT